MDKLTRGNSVKRFRVRMRMTQQELADALQISLSQVANIEIGRGRISEDVEAKLAKMGWTVDPSDQNAERPIIPRGSRRQFAMLIQILEDVNQHPELRRTAALELRAALDLNSDG
ncbi:MAG: helix-turn-helix transcriptional regulator [Chthonomonas sp.]|nr:helix-turn-helix transcriptional regulator [Chthonomonas sp.]